MLSEKPEIRVRLAGSIKSQKENNRCHKACSPDGNAFERTQIAMRTTERHLDIPPMNGRAAHLACSFCVNVKEQASGDCKKAYYDL